jgi:hypothetical protein
MEQSSQKGLILKIAAGVFIGSMAALFVYSIPGWIRNHGEEQQAEENLGRVLRLEDIKPEQFSARCGKLLKDESFHGQSVNSNGKVVEGSKLTARDVTVEVTNTSGKKEALSAEFMNLAEAGEAPNWNLSAISIYRVFDEHDRQMITFRKRPKLAVLTGIEGCVHWRIGGHLEKRGDGYYWSERGTVAGGTTFQGSSSSMRLMGWSGRRESTSRR